MRKSVKLKRVTIGKLKRATNILGLIESLQTLGFQAKGGRTHLKVSIKLNP